MPTQASSEPPDPAEWLAAANDVVDSLGAVWRLFRAYRRRPVRAEVRLYFGDNPSRSVPMTIQVPNDQAANATVTFLDQRQQVTSAPGPVVWSVSDDTLATVVPSPDGLSAQVQISAGDGTFRVRCSSGNLAGESEDVDIVPGAPATAGITVSLTAQPSPAEAEAIHEGARTASGGSGGGRHQSSSGQHGEHGPAH